MPKVGGEHTTLSPSYRATLPVPLIQVQPVWHLSTWSPSQNSPEKAALHPAGYSLKSTPIFHLNSRTFRKLRETFPHRLFLTMLSRLPIPKGNPKTPQDVPWIPGFKFEATLRDSGLLRVIFLHVKFFFLILTKALFCSGAC